MGELLGWAPGLVLGLDSGYIQALPITNGQALGHVQAFFGLGQAPDGLLATRPFFTGLPAPEFMKHAMVHIIPFYFLMRLYRVYMAQSLN